MTQSDMKPIAISVRTAGHLSGLGRTRLYELINEGRLASWSIGKRRLISLASLEELLAPRAQNLALASYLPSTNNA